MHGDTAGDKEEGQAGGGWGVLAAWAAGALHGYLFKLVMLKLEDERPWKRPRLALADDMHDDTLKRVLRAIERRAAFQTAPAPVLAKVSRVQRWWRRAARDRAQLVNALEAPAIRGCHAAADKSVICPVTLETIAFDDSLLFVGPSGKTVMYTCSAILTHVLSTDKPVCPLLRHELTLPYLRAVLRRAAGLGLRGTDELAKTIDEKATHLKLTQQGIHEDMRRPFPRFALPPQAYHVPFPPTSMFASPSPEPLDLPQPRTFDEYREVARHRTSFTPVTRAVACIIAFEHISFSVQNDPLTPTFDEEVRRVEHLAFLERAGRIDAQQVRDGLSELYYFELLCRLDAVPSLSRHSVARLAIEEITHNPHRPITPSYPLVVLGEALESFIRGNQDAFRSAVNYLNFSVWNFTISRGWTPPELAPFYHIMNAPPTLPA